MSKDSLEGDVFSLRTAAVREYECNKSEKIPRCDLVFIFDCQVYALECGAINFSFFTNPLHIEGNEEVQAFTDKTRKV